MKYLWEFPSLQVWKLLELVRIIRNTRNPAPKFKACADLVLKHLAMLKAVVLLKFFFFFFFLKIVWIVKQLFEIEFVCNSIHLFIHQFIAFLLTKY